MKDLQIIFRRYYDFYRSKCPHYEQFEICNNPNGCSCKIISEVWSYIRSILPDEFVDLTIYDFKGATSLRDCEELLDDKTKVGIDKMVVSARNKVWEYCWKKPFVDGLSPQEMDLISVIDHRFSAGTNMVIHGTHYYNVYDAEKNKQKRIALQKGKSMLSSIVLKEAIRRKMFATNKASTFGYISFPVLQNNFIDYKDEDKQEHVSDWEERDWLVIDDISYDNFEASSRIRSNVKQALNSFLMRRLEKQKPTIFVFQFNIDDCDISEQFGPVLDKIISSKSTFVVQV